MSSYLPPVAEMRFLIHDVIGLSALTQLPVFAETGPDTVDAILEEASRLAANVIAPLNRVGDIQGAHLSPDGTVALPDGWQAAYDKFRDGGWQGISAPEAEGGMGLPILVGAAVAEMWQGASMAFALCPMLTAGAIELLAAHGSDQQRALYLSRMISGEWTGTMNLTEPQAGSDLSKIRSTAAPASDGTYRISGQKIFITYGDHGLTENIVHLVLARLPDAPAGVKGISLFIVPKFLCDDQGAILSRNDVKCVSLEHKLGIHASPTAVLSFGDQGGATGYLVGRAGDGLACMFTMMNNARLAVGQQGIAISERAFQQALSYARDRKQGKSAKTGQECAIAEHPDITRMLMRIRASTDAARAISLYGAAQLDLAHHHPDPARRDHAQARADLLIPMIKAWSTDLGVENASLGVQIHGGMGFIEETGAAQHLRDARIAPIYEGTNGIQALDLIGRKVLRDQGQAMHGLIADMRDTSKNTVLPAPIAAQFADALDDLERSTADILARCVNDADLTQAIASPYLRQASLCVAGWMALRCLDRLGAGASDILDGQQAARLRRSAEFFIRQHLPEARFMATQIAQSENMLFDPITP